MARDGGGGGMATVMTYSPVEFGLFGDGVISMMKLPAVGVVKLSSALRPSPAELSSDATSVPLAEYTLRRGSKWLRFPRGVFVVRLSVDPAARSTRY